MSRLRVLVVTIVATLAATHMVAVTVAALPPNEATQPLRSSTGYLNPFFTQNWRLFAPYPVSEDRSIHFQAAWRDDAGRIVESEWVDWTDVELDLVRRKIVGGRAGYITNKLFGPLNQRWGALNAEQKDAVSQGSGPEPVGWQELGADALAVDGLPARVDRFLDYERDVVDLGTAVMASRLGDVEIVAVRYRLRRHPVAHWDARNWPDEIKGDNRPAFSDREGTWRPAGDVTDALREAVASFDRRHR